MTIRVLYAVSSKAKKFPKLVNKSLLLNSLLYVHFWPITEKQHFPISTFRKTSYSLPHSSSTALCSLRTCRSRWRTWPASCPDTVRRTSDSCPSPCPWSSWWPPARRNSTAYRGTAATAPASFRHTSRRTFGSLRRLWSSRTWPTRHSLWTCRNSRWRARGWGRGRGRRPFGSCSSSIPRGSPSEPAWRSYWICPCSPLIQK